MFDHIIWTFFVKTDYSDHEHYLSTDELIKQITKPRNKKVVIGIKRLTTDQLPFIKSLINKHVTYCSLYEFHIRNNNWLIQMSEIKINLTGLWFSWVNK